MCCADVTQHVDLLTNAVHTAGNDPNLMRTGNVRNTSTNQAFNPILHLAFLVIKKWEV